MTEQDYLPAMGRHWMLFLYDPLTRVAGIRRVHGELLDRAGIEPRHRVLEIGCGTGNLLLTLARRLPVADALGTDPDPAALRRARRKAARAGLPVRFERGFAGALPVPDGSVDRVLSSYMLHHLGADERARAMAEIRRVLRPGGQLHVVDIDGAHAHGAAGRHPLIAGSVPARVLAAMREAGLTAATETGRGRRFGPIGSYVFYRAAA